MVENGLYTLKIYLFCLTRIDSFLLCVFSDKTETKKLDKKTDWRFVCFSPHARIFFHSSSHTTYHTQKTTHARKYFILSSSSYIVYLLTFLTLSFIETFVNTGYFVIWKYFFGRFLLFPREEILSYLVGCFRIKSKRFGSNPGNLSHFVGWKST
jgi:hypothetical protein